MSRGLLACALCMTTGCSLFFVDGPPARKPPPPQVVSCTTSSNSPGADRAIAVMSFVLGTAATVVNGAKTSFDDGSLGVFLGFAILPATVFGLSSRAGYNRMKACERYYETHGD